MNKQPSLLKEMLKVAKQTIDFTRYKWGQNRSGNDYIDRISNGERDALYMAEHHGLLTPKNTPKMPHCKPPKEEPQSGSPVQIGATTDWAFEEDIGTPNWAGGDASMTQEEMEVVINKQKGCAELRSHPIQKPQSDK